MEKILAVLIAAIGFIAIVRILWARAASGHSPASSYDATSADSGASHSTYDSGCGHDGGGFSDGGSCH
jgi:ABC-type nickel/cobalt efflux system permease component RcnA